MKKNLLVISTVLIFGVAVIGCATKGDLDRMQAREQQLNLKTDQALKASQEANETAKRASQAVEAAEERARIAEEKAEKAEATFKGSMRK